MGFLGLLIPLTALSIPIVAIVLSHRRSSQNTKLKELELQKEILRLEVERQNGKIKLLEEENKKYDKIIFDNTN